jgi:hypothetical protein
VATATQFFGLGINPRPVGTQRYQVPTSGNHKFYAGSNQVMALDGSGDLSVTNNLSVGGSISIASNVSTKAWTVSPTIMLASGCTDCQVGSNAPTNTLNREDGNPGNSQFYGGLLNGYDASGLSLAWNSARLLLRGCMMWTGSNASTVTANVNVYSSASSNWTTLTTTTLKDYGMANGYTTNVTPAFSLGTAGTAACVLGIQFTSSTSSGMSTTYRMGQVQLIPIT